MNIKKLGSGCKNCKTLYHNAILAVNELGIEAEVEKITDFEEIAKYGIMRMPGLVIDGKVVFYGKVSTKEEIISAIKS